MSSSVKNWVNDRLHDVLGLSDSAVAEYLIRLTQQKSTKDEVAEELRTEIGMDVAIEKFIGELWTKLRGLFI